MAAISLSLSFISLKTWTIITVQFKFFPRKACLKISLTLPKICWILLSYIWSLQKKPYMDTNHKCYILVFIIIYSKYTPKKHETSQVNLLPSWVNFTGKLKLPPKTGDILGSETRKEDKKKERKAKPRFVSDQDRNKLEKQDATCCILETLNLKLALPLRFH